MKIAEDERLSRDAIKDPSAQGERYLQKRQIDAYDEVHSANIWAVVVNP